LRSFAPRGGVRDRFRPLSTPRPSRVLCSPLFPFPGSPHSRAALAIRTRRAGDRAGPVYNTSRPAEACKTTCAASHPPNSSRMLSRPRGSLQTLPLHLPRRLTHQTLLLSCLSLACTVWAPWTLLRPRSPSPAPSTSTVVCNIYNRTCQIKNKE